MVFLTKTTSRKSIEAGILILFAALVLCGAGFFERNVTDTSTSSTIVETSIPFPGAEWLDRIANADTKMTLEDGTTYSSAYAAILNNEPLAHPCRNFNAWVNSLFFSPSLASKIVTALGVEWGHYVLCYLRNFIGAMVVYYGTASIFHYFCYVHPMSKTIFAHRPKPTWDVIFHQIRLAQTSLFFYTLLPTLDEWFIESGYTQVYYTVDEIGGWPKHLATMLFYFACVEIGVYWMHRTLHTNKTLYKYIHLKHHYYNKPETLSPWASIAFHPLDGILQASPYVYLLPFIPCHYMTHVGMVVFTAIWATYIHDAMDWNIDPIMGSKFHTYHHTHYIYNYGQVFIFCDWFWGTLRYPPVPTGSSIAKVLLKNGDSSSLSNNDYGKED